jgi:hypothetical protein
MEASSEPPARVVYGAGRPPWPPARPVRPIDLRARLVRVKRALTGGHGKSDLPCPRWLPRGPPRRRGSGRGRNGAYGMSGTDAVACTGRRALTLWATTGRWARTGRTDEKDGRARTRIAQTILWAQTEAVGTDMWARTFRAVYLCGRGRYGGYSYAGADVIAKKTLNQNFDFDCVLTFLRQKKNILYSFIHFTCRLQQSFAK